MFCVISAIKCRGEEAPPSRGLRHSAILLSLNNSIVRTNFHCLAIYNALVRFDFDFDNLGCCDFNMKLHCNLELFFHNVCLYKKIP